MKLRRLFLKWKFVNSQCHLTMSKQFHEKTLKCLHTSISRWLVVFKAKFATARIAAVLTRRSEWMTKCCSLIMHPASRRLSWFCVKAALLEIVTKALSKVPQSFMWSKATKLLASYNVRILWKRGQNRIIIAHDDLDLLAIFSTILRRKQSAFCTEKSARDLMQ